MKKQISKYAPNLLALFLAVLLGVSVIRIDAAVPYEAAGDAGDVCSAWSQQSVENLIEVRARNCNILVGSESSTKFEVEVTGEAGVNADPVTVKVSILDKKNGSVLSENRCGPGTKNGSGPNGHVDLNWGEQQLRCPLTIPDVDTKELGISIELEYPGSPGTLGSNGVYDV